MKPVPDIERAAAILKQGGLVAIPTETVYGLAADAHNIAAIRKVFAVKGRPADHPVIVHIGNKQMLGHFAREIPFEANKLISAFWPGPLTLVFKKQPAVPDIITGAQDTVALRMPAHPVAQALLTAFGGALVAPSANLYGRVSPTQKAHVEKELGAKVDMVLEGGDSEIGIESTILDVSTRPFTLLRQGMIKKSELEKVIGEMIQDANDTTKTRVPGMKKSHYAPATPLILAAREDIAKFIKQYQNAVFICLAHRPSSGAAHHLLPQVEKALILPDNPEGYAHALYATLRQADQLGADKIIVELPPADEAWLAILDRLKRAACQ